MSTIRINKLEDLAGNNVILVSDLGKSVQGGLRVLGSFSTPPTTRNNNSPLQVGDTYFSIPDNSEMSWNGTSWGLSAGVDLTNLLVSSLKVVGTYSSSIPVTVRRVNECIEKDGALWIAKASTPLPFVTTGTWATDVTKLTVVGDEAVRNDLKATTGATQVGTTLPSGVAATVFDYMVMLEKRTAPSIYEHANLITSKPTPSNPDTWNWTPAIQAAASTGRAYLFPEGLYQSGPITCAPGFRIHGEGGGRFLDISVKTVIRSLSSGAELFITTASTFTGQREGISVFDARLESDFPYRSGDPTALIVDGGSSPYEMRSFIYRSSFASITTNSGTGVLLAKTFDHVVANCDITGFSRGIVEIGCDLGHIHHNRITNFSEYGILQLGASTFGSQTKVEINDILGGGTNAVYIKTTARHVILLNNYLERSSGTTTKGFIDVSSTDAPVYGPNAVSTTRLSSVIVQHNRIDGKSFATEHVYRYEPFGYFASFIDVNTSGPAGNISWLTVVGGELPIMGNVTNSASYEFRGGSQIADIWRNFTQVPVSTTNLGVSFNNRSLLDLNHSELRRNNSYLNVRLIERGIVIKQALGITLFHCIFRGEEGIENIHLRDGVTYNVKVVARARTSNGSLSIVKIVNAAQQGSTVTTTLTNQNTVISTTMIGAAASAKVGLAFHVNGSTDDVVISSVTFEAV